MSADDVMPIRADEVRAGDEIVGPTTDPLRRDCGIVEDPDQTCKWPSPDQRLIGFVPDENGRQLGIAVQREQILFVKRSA